MKSTLTIPFRRKLSGATDYRFRRRQLASRKPRFVIRRSLKYLTIQVLSYTPTGDHVIVHASSKELKNVGWNFGMKNTPACYLTGIIVGRKAVKKGIREGIIDIGPYTATKGSKLFAAAQGIRDGGVSISLENAILPSLERLSGKHIATYAKTSGGHQFSTSKNTSDVEKVFNHLKGKLLT